MAHLPKTSDLTVAFAAALIAALALVFVSPALGEDDDEYTSTDEDGRVCFFVRTIDDFHVIDNEHVVLRGAGRRYYLATLFSDCTGLRFTESIALTSRTGTICEYGGEYIVFDDTGFRQRCYIDKVERVDDIAAARALVEQREADAEQGDDAQ